jgi:F420-dependent oxidoreductase-like protein
MNPSLQLGISVFPQYTTWDALRQMGQRVDELGYDQLWTWDHFLPIIGDPKGPNFECWTVLSAWAALTSRVKLGALVCGNTYRNPAVLTNMAVTLDHISHGRAILGLGAAWFELEHNAYGIEFGTAGQRLAKLAEAAPIVRSLMDNTVTNFNGKYYQMHDARCEPKPVQARLPIMIGGGGEKKTLRIVAQYADQWNGFGAPDEIRHKLEVLRGHCREVGRKFDDILPTVLLNVIVRDDEKDAEPLMERIRTRNRIEKWPHPPVVGNVDKIAKTFAAFYDAGVRGIIMGQAAPYDIETLERVATQVRPRVTEMLGAAAR